jgi:hypothetical protein
MIRSDHLSIRSDEYTESFRPRSAKATPQTAEGSATTRARATWRVDRDLQAVRAAKLPLSRRSRSWPEAISGDQSAWGTSPQRVRTKRRLRPGRSVAWQLSPAARCAQRDLRDQCRTPATTRRSRIGGHGPGVNWPRLVTSGCHCRRYDCVLSRRRRSAVQSGAAR